MRRKLKDVLGVSTERSESEGGALCTGSCEMVDTSGAHMGKVCRPSMSAQICGHACPVNKIEAQEDGQCGQDIFKFPMC